MRRRSGSRSGESRDHGRRADPRSDLTRRANFCQTTVVIPPQNDIDLHANDMNFRGDSAEKRQSWSGFNLLVGGGLSIEHGNKNPPCTASEFGFAAGAPTPAVAEAVVTTQRDWGNRTDRKNAKPNTPGSVRRRDVQRRSGRSQVRDQKFGRSAPYVNSPVAAIRIGCR